jgi:hypothetical protein
LRTHYNCEDIYGGCRVVATGVCGAGGSKGGLAWFWLLLNAHRHRSISGAAGHIILTPANQLMVMGLKVWSLSNPGFEPGAFRSLAQRANHLR